MSHFPLVLEEDQIPSPTPNVTILAQMDLVSNKGALHRRSERNRAYLCMLQYVELLLVLVSAKNAAIKILMDPGHAHSIPMLKQSYLKLAYNYHTIGI